MQFPTGLKEDLRKNQKSCLVKGPATLSSSTALFEPGLNSWPFYPEKPSGDSAQMTNTKCIRKECPPFEKFSGNKEAVVGVECDDMEMMRQLKALKSSIFNEKDDPRVYRKIGSISRMENPNERKIHGVSNSTAILLSRIGKDHTAELTEARIIRQSGGKDRHSKVVTSRGLRDRRVRLSVRTAVQFYEVVDRLGYDQPSKAVEWLIKEAKSAIDELACLPDLGLQKFNAVDWASAGNASRIQKKPILDAADYGSCWTSFSSCNDSSTLKGTRVSGMNPTPEKVGFESARMSESMNGDFATQGHKSFLEKESSFADPHDLSSIFKQAMDCWSSLRNETKNRASSFACAEFQQVAQEREKKKAAANGSRVEACGEAAAYLPYRQPDHSFYGALSDAHQRAASRCGQQEASQFDRGPSEGAIICKSTSSSSIEAPQRSAFPQNFWQNMALYASQNHKTPLSQSGLQGQFHPDPFQFSYPDASALRSSQFHSSVALLHGTLSTITQFPPSFPAMSQALSSNTGNDVQENANIVVPSEIPGRGSNIVSPPAVSSIRSVPDFDDVRNSNVALLQSNALLPPEVKDSRLPITFQGSIGDQITKIAPLHQGYLVNSLLAGGCSVLDQEDLSLQGSAYAEQMLSSIRSPLTDAPLTDAGADFASPSTFPLAYSSMGSLQSIQINPVPPSGTSGREISSRPGPGFQIVPTATRNSHRSFMSSSSQIPARIYCIEDSEDDWMA